MKIYRSLINENRALDIETTVSFDDSLFKDSFPLLGISNVKVVGEFDLEDGHYLAHLDIDADVKMADARTNEPFVEHLFVQEDPEIMSSYEEDGDGYVFAGNAFELEDLILLIIRSYIPISPHKENENFL